jgi:glycosyltransferase 2 family protein
MSTPTSALPDELDVRRLGRRALEIIVGLAVLALIAWLMPGLGDMRHRLENASAGWVAVGVVLEVLSSLSYAVMFRPVFCSHLSRRTSAELALSEVGVGSLVPASGAGGLALGVWALRRVGMPTDQIGRRTVAFFLIKSAANFVAVAVVGVLILTGVLKAGGRDGITLAFTIAAVAVMAIVARRGGSACARCSAGR